MKKKGNFLFTPWFMGVLFILFAMTMAFATFYENDFGAVAARALVYETWWFELIMLLMIVNLIGQVFHFKLYKKKKITILFFHFAFVLIIIGAGVTRYLGFEGVMHIRENESQNICTSLDKYLNLDLKDLDGNTLFSDSKKLIITSVKKEKYNKKLKIDEVNYSLKLTKYLPNASESIIDIENGKPIVSLILSNDMMLREKIFLTEGEIKNLGDVSIGFVEDDSVDIRITFQGDIFKIQSEYSISEMSMMSQEAIVYEGGLAIPIEKMKIYKVKGFSIVPEVLCKNGVVKVVNRDFKTHSTNKSALVFELTYENKLTELNLWIEQGTKNKIEFIKGNHSIELNYNPLEIELPFRLKLEEFILERYPGSSSPSSYKSNVVLIDEKEGLNKSYSIYMNHILKYKGWRFYQSSYDKDEHGTILSVNKDFAGMLITYAGYFMLFLFLILSLINKNSAFRTVTKSFFKSTSSKVVTLFVLFFIVSTHVYSQEQKFVVEKSIADEFGKILVQNQKGRTEPLYTLSHDILRKVTRKTQFDAYSPMQVFLGIYFDFEHWQKVPLIKISNPEIQKLIGINGSYASFSDVVDLKTNIYKIKQDLDLAYAKPSGARNKFDKEIIKVDERLNICFMIYSGEFLKIFPVSDQSLKWYAPKDAFKYVSSNEDSLFLRNILTLFAKGIQAGNEDGDYAQANEVIKSIINYQRNFAQYELPDFNKVNAEIFYYKSKIYEKLFPFYATIGVILLIILFYGVISQNQKSGLIINIFKGFLIGGFGFHTLGLAIRWYVSGHAPMSNGYESMIFISWVTLLAGFIFSKRSAFVLASTSVLGGFTLMVAHLSFMDPEITNLVPVLQSYWLTLHVSVITGSYGFLGLGAIIGIIVLILYSLITERNKENILCTIEELTVINFKSLIIGLYLLTIGTFLGAIWANESWGRYWGWDPKETWSLITIIVYSFIIHSRMIPGLKGFFAFNVLAMVGFGSVLMTYFGVNYYLTGLHSYAGGDPVPVPNFVYISIFSLISLIIVAFWKRSKYKII